MRAGRRPRPARRTRAGRAVTHPRRLVATALATLALGSGWAAVRPEAVPDATAPAAPRPLWSPERLPALLAEAQGSVELARAADTLLGGLPSSCLVVYEDDRPVLTRRPDLPLTPASTQKVLVAAAALHALGPDFRFETRLVAAEAPHDGMVGPLWLVGAGDPSLATPEYAAYLAERPRTAGRAPTPLVALVEALTHAGVRSVAGGITGDDSRYDRARSVPTWKPNYVTDNEVGPLGALMVDGGFREFVPPETRADDPAAHAAAELTRLAVERGVAVAGPPAAGLPPAHARTVAQVRSAPLRDVAAAMVRESDNATAELLVRELGRHARGDGSTPAGIQALVDELAGMGLPVEGLRLGDGSGLEATNTATCRLLTQVVRTDAGVQASLAVAGRTGTLVRRFADTPLEGRLRGKTGSIKGVSGLTGMVDGHRTLSFALLANGSFSDADGRLLQDRLVSLLANYPGPQPAL